MDFFGDYHLHTCHSDGRAKVRDMVEVAHLKGLTEVGIADHGPGNIGAGVKRGEVYGEIREELKALEKEYPQIKMLVGAEADIINLEGKIDINKEVIKELDYLLVGLHPYVYPDDFSTAWHYVLGNGLAKINKGLKEKVKNINTKTLVECIAKYDVLAVTHPGLKMEIDHREVARICEEKGTALEINTGHKFPGLKEVLQVANLGVNFIVNSDAHFPETVGEFAYGGYILKKANIPVERVLNAT